MKKQSRRGKPPVLVFTGDQHFGGSSGLLPPGFVSFEGNKISQNPYQKWAWKGWEKCWKWAENIIGDDDWIPVFNGDLIDGNHHDTREIISADVHDHVSACVEGLLPFIKDAKAVYFTEGTNVHTNNSEHGIAASLKYKGVNIVKHNKQQHAWPSLDLVVHGSRVSVDHHMSSSVSSLSASAAYSRTIGDIVNKRTRAHWKVPSVIVRSHRHEFGIWQDSTRSMICLPAWQGNTRFQERVATGAIPEVGMVILDWREVGFAQQPVIKKLILQMDQPFTNYL